MSTHLSQYHLVERIQHQIAHSSGRTALREWSASGETQLTWFQAGARIRRIASALLSLGIDAQERVALFSHNSLNWSLADLATLYVRGVTVPIYRFVRARYLRLRHDGNLRHGIVLGSK